MNNTLLTNEILTDGLYRAVEHLTATDKTVNADILILNYLTYAGFYNSNKTTIRAGDSSPINSNLYTLIVGNSGFGKSRSNRLFLAPTFTIQKNLFIEHNKVRDFVKACESIVFDAMKMQPTETEKSKFIETYNDVNGTSFEEFMLKPPKEHIFLPSDFTPEKLTKTFNHSKNNTLLVNTDEFENLKNNFGRSKNIENLYTELTQYFDGRSDFVIRLGSDSACNDGAYLSLLGNTTPQTFATLQSSNFFNSGCGYRYLFFIQGESNLTDPLKTNKLTNTNDLSTYERFQNKMQTILQNYFFDMVYNNNNEPVIFQINTDDNLNLFDSYVSNLWNQHIKENETLNDSQKEAIKSRIKTMLLKVILNTHLMNYSYDNFENWQPFKPIAELPPEAITRGYKAYNYLLGVMLRAIDTSGKNDLTPLQMEVINLIPEGTEMSISRLKHVVVDQKGIIQKSAFYQLMKKNTGVFATYENSKKERFIKRLI